MVGALDSRESSLGLSPGRGHCAVFLGTTLYSNVASLYPGVQMGTSEFNSGGNPVMGGVEILLVASCFCNKDKLRPDEPLGSNANFTYLCHGRSLKTPGVGEGSPKPKRLKHEQVKQEFQRVGRGETKNLPWGGYGCFSE